MVALRHRFALARGGRRIGKSRALAAAQRGFYKCKTGFCKPHARCSRCMTENPIT